ncbi:MAG: hypothetical protein ABL951_05570 [Alphaproteobacteria bacterium]
MTREEFNDLLKIMALSAIPPHNESQGRYYQAAIKAFIAKHIQPLEDAEDNAICDERRDMPTVAVKIEDL